MLFKASFPSLSRPIRCTLKVSHSVKCYSGAKAASGLFCAKYGFHNAASNIREIFVEFVFSFFFALELQQNVKPYAMKPLIIKHFISKICKKWNISIGDGNVCVRRYIKTKEIATRIEPNEKLYAIVHCCDYQQ